MNLQTLYLDSESYQKKKTANTPLVQDTPAHTPKARVSQSSVDSIRNPKPVVNQKNSDRDSAYMDAIERGDMETAQEMVEQAAKDSGYTRLFYHGSKKGGGFTIFRDWQYFTENKEYAKRYTEKGKAESLYTTNVKMDNPFDTRIAEVRDQHPQTHKYCRLDEKSF